MKTSLHLDVAWEMVHIKHAIPYTAKLSWFLWQIVNFSLLRDAATANIFL